MQCFVTKAHVACLLCCDLLGCELLAGQMVLLLYFARGEQERTWRVWELCGTVRQKMGLGSSSLLSPTQQSKPNCAVMIENCCLKRGEPAAEIPFFFLLSSL